MIDIDSQVARHTCLCGVVPALCSACTMRAARTAASVCLLCAEPPTYRRGACGPCYYWIMRHRRDLEWLLAAPMKAKTLRFERGPLPPVRPALAPMLCPRCPEARLSFPQSAAGHCFKHWQRYERGMLGVDEVAA
jgi:hypothetical protein